MKAFLSCWLASFFTAGILPACGSANTQLPPSGISFSPDKPEAPPSCAQTSAAYLDAIPPLLTLKDKSPVNDTAHWHLRREEILQLLETGEYGALPSAIQNAQPRLIWEDSAKTMAEQSVLRRQGVCKYLVNGIPNQFHILVYTPLMGKGPFPAVMCISAFNDMFWDPDCSKSGDFFPVSRLAQAGYACILVKADDITQEGWQQQLSGEQNINCGAISMWAWAACTARRCVAELPEISADKIAITGCSRAGKAALWAFAQDKAFSCAAVNVTGCSGAALTRIKTGERVADITAKFPDWLHPAYSQYANKEHKLPFDQHFLLALAAPRPLYIASAEDDLWSDPAAEFYACAAASPAWELYGEQAFSACLPPPDTVLNNGRLWYHMRSGGHGLNMYDWDQYLLFFGRYLKSELSSLSKT